MKLKKIYLLLAIIMSFNLVFIQSPRIKQLFEQLNREYNSSVESDSGKTVNSNNSIFGSIEEKEPENINFSQKSEKTNSRDSLFILNANEKEKTKATPTDNRTDQENQQNNSESSDRSIFGQSSSESNRKAIKESHNQDITSSNNQKPLDNHPKLQSPIQKSNNQKPPQNNIKPVVSNTKSNGSKPNFNISKPSTEISSLLAKHTSNILKKISNNDDEKKDDSDSQEEKHKKLEKTENKKEKVDKNDKPAKDENNKDNHNTEIKKLEKQVTSLIRMNERLMKIMRNNYKSHKVSNRNHQDIINFLQTHGTEIESIKDVNHNERKLENNLLKKESEIKKLVEHTNKIYGDLENKFEKVNNQVHQIKEEEKKNLNDLSSEKIMVKDSLEVAGETKLNKINANEIDLGQLLLTDNVISFENNGATIKLGKESISVYDMFNSLKSVRKLLDMCGENFEKCIRKEEELHERQFAAQKDILESLRVLEGQTAEIISTHKRRLSK